MAERIAIHLSTAMYPVVWFLACLSQLRGLESSQFDLPAVIVAATVSASYFGGQIVGRMWTRKIFLCADPVAIPIAAGVSFAVCITSIAAGLVEAPQIIAIVKGATIGFIIGHPVVLVVAASTDTLLKKLVQKNDSPPGWL